MTAGGEKSTESAAGSKPFVPGSPWQRLYFRAKRWYRTGRAWLTDPHYRTLACSGLFACRFYLNNDPGLDPRYTDPLLHYLEAGWREGRKPNPLFDSGFYRELNPECAESDPLLHYIEKGWRAGADPTPLFFTAWYGHQYPQSIRSGRSPLSHYLRTGWRQGCRPNPYADLAPYLAAHPELRAGGIHPLGHYVDFGFRDPAGPLPCFDPAYYLEDNPAAATMAMSPLAHYLQYGVREGRAPNRFFDAVYYLAQHPEAGPSALTAFLHFNAIGQAQGWRPSPLFDPAYYGRTYPAYRQTHAHALCHYQDLGIARGHYPCAEVAELARKPVISVVTPVYNTDAALLLRCIHSVLFQAYPHWELCLADDGSDQPQVRQILEEYAARDDRIKVSFLEKNQGIAGASNAAAALAEGEYLAFLDHDDELTLDALFEVARATGDQGTDLIYTDEDLVNLESRRQDTFYKPDFNPELLLTHNYITHLLVTRRELFARVGGFSAEYEGAQDYDLTLKLSEQARRIVHLPLILYHWRASATSTSVNHSQKIYADAGGKKALEAALARRGIRGAVEQGQWRFYYRVRREVAGNPTLSLIVRLVGNEETAADWYARLAPSLPAAGLEIHCLAAASGRGEGAGSFRYHPPEAGASPAARCNSVARQCSGYYLLFLAGEFVPDDPAWLRYLLEMAQEEATGAVTGLVARPEEGAARPELHETTSWRQYRRFFLEGARDLNNIYCEQNVLAVPAELCLLRREVFVRAGGLDEQRFPQVFHDLDLSLRLRQQGYRNVYTPCCRGHLTGAGEPINDDAAALELVAFRQQWREELRQGDPYYNPGRFCEENKITRQQWLAWYTGEIAHAA